MMNTKKIFPWSALIVGSLTALTGIACIVMYVLEAIIKRLGEGDQSLLFWYLPFLIFGLIGIIMGLGMGLWGASRLKKIQRQNTATEN